MYAQTKWKRGNSFTKRGSCASCALQRTKAGTLKASKFLAQNTHEFCKHTTLHGLKYVTSEELYTSERIYFAISIAVVVVISGFLIFKVYGKWSTTPVIFGIKPEPTYIVNEPFPAVTICNLNQALKSEAIKYAQNSTEYAMLQLLCKRQVNKTVANSITDWKILESFILNISQPCKNMIIGCHFGGVEYNCSEMFFPILTNEGLCCVFNMLHPKFMFVSYVPLTFTNRVRIDAVPVDWYAEKGYDKPLPHRFYPRTTPGTGESLGLSLILDVEYDKYYCSSSYSIGFKVAFHSPNESPNVRETGVLIAPGKESKVRIHPEKTESEQHLHAINKKYRHCLFHSEGGLRYFAHYTQRNCEMECVAEMLMKFCGCITFYMPKIYDNATICSVQKSQCVEMIRLRTDPNVDTCLDFCMPSCYDLTFLGDISAAEISVDSALQSDNEKLQNFSAKYVQQNIAVIKMYFKEYSFRSSIQTEFIGVTEFLAGVGGIMGLFLGFSFISIVELVYFAILRPCHTFLQSRNAQVTAEVPKQMMQQKRRAFQLTQLPEIQAYARAHPTVNEEYPQQEVPNRSHGWDQSVQKLQRAPINKY